MTSAVAQHLAQQPTPPGGPHTLARVIEVHRDALVLHDGNAAQTARLLPGLARALLDVASAQSVGDWVLCATDTYAQVWVHARLEPLSHIVRRDGDGLRHSVVSNVDTALVVMGLDLDFNPQRLERYLALIHGSGVVPVVVLTQRCLREMPLSRLSAPGRAWLRGALRRAPRAPAQLPKTAARKSARHPDPAGAPGATGAMEDEVARQPGQINVIYPN